MELFSASVKIHSGKGSLSFLKTLGAQRVFLVTDPYFAKNGTAEKLLKETGAEHTRIFDRVTPDPTVELAAEGTADFQAFEPDLLVALGGGSSMDCAKAIYCFSKSRIHFAAIPTTSGSGSEVTDFAILTHDGIKHPLVDPSIRPGFAILDPDLLEALPKSLIADAGFDVLSHALEAIAARGAGTISNLFAKEAFRLAFQNLPASFHGDLRARLPVHEAATLAGLAFNQAGLGLCHSLSHSLGGLFHVPHGRLNAILMPAVVEANAGVAGHAYAELARYAGLGGTADTVALRNLKNGLIRLRKQLNLPDTLVKAGAASKDVRAHMGKILESVLKDPCSDSNPTAVTEALVKKVLGEVMGSE